MYSPFKMKGKSPMMKALIGKQNNLPAELKAKIEAAPESPAKMKKASAKKGSETDYKPGNQQARQDTVQTYLKQKVYEERIFYEDEKSSG